jgi:hypothetical protein
MTGYRALPGTTPDGRTYWVTQSFMGLGGFLYSVDLTDPSHPKELPLGSTRVMAGPTG